MCNNYMCCCNYYNRFDKLVFWEISNNENPSNVTMCENCLSDRDYFYLFYYKNGFWINE